MIELIDHVLTHDAVVTGITVLVTTSIGLLIRWVELKRMKQDKEDE